MNVRAVPNSDATVIGAYKVWYIKAVSNILLVIFVINADVFLHPHVVPGTCAKMKPLTSREDADDDLGSCSG